MSELLIRKTGKTLGSADEWFQEAPPPAEAPKVKPYPLDTCIVSDEKLGSMGNPVVFTHEGQEIKLCCKSCKPKFLKDPATYLKKLKK